MQKKCIEQLPADYRGVRKIDLQNDKKLAIPLNIAVLIVAVALIYLGTRFVPLTKYFSSTDLKKYFIHCGLLIFSLIAYLILHEAVHGLFFRLFGAKPHFGFTSLYAYAGAKAFFRRREYLIIALAPVMIWGVLLAILCAVLPAKWFWLFYGVQVINLSGSVGDLYVTFALSRMPRNILIRDTGVAMTVFARVRPQHQQKAPSRTSGMPQRD